MNPRERTDATLSGDDTAGSDDHNRRVEPAEPARSKPLFRDHGEEIAAALNGTHPALQDRAQS